MGEVSMGKQAVNQGFENSNMEVAREALGKSIARWTDKSDRVVTAIPGLILARRDEPNQPTSIMDEPRIWEAYICVKGQHDL